MGDNKINDVVDKVKDDKKSLDTETMDFATVKEISGRGNKGKGKKYIIIGAICIGALIAGVGTYYGVSSMTLVNSYNNKVYPSLKLFGKDIGGLTNNELHNVVQGILSDLENKEIKVTIGDRKYEIAHRALELNIDCDDLEKEIMNYGKDENFFEKLALIKDPKEKEYDIKLNYNEDGIKEFVKKISDEVYVAPKDASIDISGGQVSVAAGQVGSELNSEELINNIKATVENLNSEDITTIAGNLQEVKPKITEESLSTVDTMISSYTTNFKAGPSGTNIQVGTRNVDNIVLMPGAQFSGIDAIGPTTPELGFVQANTYVDGQVVKGYGGGVCQIITTLYNAELRAGIVPLERTNHMMTVSYVPMGLDATIGDYAPDLLFNNPYEYPIVVNAYTTGESVTVEFWSNSKATGGITYVPEAYPTGALSADTYLYGYDSAGNRVYSQYLNSSTYKPFS